MPYAPWGDFFAACSLISAFKEKNQASRVVVLCDSEKRESLARAFHSIDVVERISVKDYFYLCGRGYKNGELRKENIFAISHWQSSEFKNISPRNIFCCYANMLGLSEPFGRELPQYSDDDKRIARGEFAKLGLGKTVFLSPFSVSFDYTVLPKSFWINLAQALEDAGLDIVFNANNDDFPNYKRVFLPIAQQVEFAKLCHGCIAFRSGLVDILAGSGLKNITAIYPPHMKFLTMSSEEMKSELKRSFYMRNDLPFEENIFNICSLKNNFNENFDEIVFDGDEGRLVRMLAKKFLGKEAK